MKKVIILLVCVVGIYACKPSCCDCSKPQKPKNVSPIDWSNYNSVYTAFWNFCDNHEFFQSVPSNTLMVCGYIGDYDANYLALLDDSIAAVSKNYFSMTHSNPPFIIINLVNAEISNIINFSNPLIHNKCYIKGQIIEKKQANDCGGYYVLELLTTDWGIHFND